MNVVISGSRPGIGQTLAEHLLARGVIAVSLTLVDEAEFAAAKKGVDHDSRQ